MSFNSYSFIYNSAFDEEGTGSFPAQTYSNKNIKIDDGAPWPVVMREFANFMSGIYGYNITEKILIEEWDGDHGRLDDYGV